MSSPQTALVTGASGLLGRAVTTAFNRKSWSVTGTGLTRANPPAILAVDLSDTNAVAKALDDVKPSVVVHCTLSLLAHLLTPPDLAGKKETQVNTPQAQQTASPTPATPTPTPPAPST